MATIRPMRDKWQAIVRRKGHPTLSTSFVLKKDAEKWARQQEGLIDAGRWVDRTEAEQTTLWELLDRYGKEVSNTKRGVKAEMYRIGQFKRSSLAKYSPAVITSQLIAEWRDSRLKEVSSGTVLRDLQLLGHVFTVAIREWGINLPRNPVAFVRKPAAGKSRDHVLSKLERDNLLEALCACRNPWIKPVVIFALETAARRGEILALNWSGIDLERHTAKLMVTKAGQPRTIPLSSACTEMLKTIPRSIDGRVFPVSVETLKQAYERAVKRAGIEDFNFHDLRHDALTRLARIGLSVLELRAISGHTTANMLQRYVNIDAGDLARKLG